MVFSPRRALASLTPAVVFILLACPLIPALGPQDDEALFSLFIWQPHRTNDVMLMSYVGADKGFLYRAIFSIFEPNLWSLRLPVVLIGAVTVALFFATLRRFLRDWAAFSGSLLLATDPMFVLTRTFDWGPLALQHFFLVAGVFLACAQPPRVFAAFLFFGLALWDKAISTWALFALAASTVALFRTELARAITVRRVMHAVAGLIIGGLPLWVWNYRHGFRTFREHAAFSAEILWYKTRLLLDCLTGPPLIGWMFRGPLPYFLTLTVALLALALIAGRRRRTMWFGALTAALIFLQMLFIRNAGTGAHHTMLVWPWLHWAIAAGLPARRWARFAVAAGVLANLAMMGHYIWLGWTHGGTPMWSDAIVTAAREIRVEPGETVLAADWGIEHPLILLTDGRLPTQLDTKDLSRHLVVTHIEEVFANAGAKLDAEAAAQGLRREAVATWNDRHGRPTIVAFRYRPLE